MQPRPGHPQLQLLQLADRRWAGVVGAPRGTLWAWWGAALWKALARVIFGDRKELKHIQPEMGLVRVCHLPGALQPPQHTLTEPGHCRRAGTRPSQSNDGPELTSISRKSFALCWNTSEKLPIWWCQIEKIPVTAWWGTGTVGSTGNADLLHRKVSLEYPGLTEKLPEWIKPTTIENRNR